MLLITWSLNLTRPMTLCSPLEKSCIVCCPGSGFSRVHKQVEYRQVVKLGSSKTNVKLRREENICWAKNQLFQNQRQHKLQHLCNGLLNQKRANFCHQLKLMTPTVMKLTLRLQFITRFLCLTLWSDRARAHLTTADKLHTYPGKRGYFSAPRIHIPQARKALPQRNDTGRPQLWTHCHLLSSSFSNSFPSSFPSTLISSKRNTVTSIYHTVLRKPEN